MNFINNKYIPISLKCFTNAEYLVIGWPFTSKSTQMITSKLVEIFDGWPLLCQIYNFTSSFISSNIFLFWHYRKTIIVCLMTFLLQNSTSGFTWRKLSILNSDCVSCWERLSGHFECTADKTVERHLAANCKCLLRVGSVVLTWI